MVYRIVACQWAVAAFDVAPGDQVQQLAVAANAALHERRIDVVHVLGVVRLNHLLEEHGERGQSCVARALDERFVHCRSRETERNAVASVGCVCRQFNRSGQRCEVCPSVVTGELAGDLRLDHLTGSIEVTDRRALDLQSDGERPRNRLDAGVCHERAATASAFDGDEAL